jgi:hypothetical protein
METQTAIPQANWENYTTEFPSVAEYNANSPENALAKGDKVPDGRYQLALTSISDPMPNPFPDPRNKNPKPIVFLYFTVVQADDPLDVGRVVRKKVTYSGHPMSSAYPFLEMAYGGSIPPDVRPTFTAMKDMQISVVFITRKGIGKTGEQYEYQAWEALQPVAERNHLQVVPF